MVVRINIPGWHIWMDLTDVPSNDMYCRG